MRVRCFVFELCALFVAHANCAFLLLVAVSVVLYFCVVAFFRVGVSSLWFSSLVSSPFCLFVVWLLRSMLVLELIVCEHSTTPPGGNQVDGLPPALSGGDGPFWFENSIDFISASHPPSAIRRGDPSFQDFVVFFFFFFRFVLTPVVFGTRHQCLLHNVAPFHASVAHLMFRRVFRTPPSVPPRGFQCNRVLWTLSFDFLK